MGCCQNDLKHDPKEMNLQKYSSLDPNTPNYEILKELIDQFNYKQKHVTMIIDKLDVESQLLLSKKNFKYALFDFKKKILFQEFLRQIDNNLQTLNKNEKAKAHEKEENFRLFLNDVQNCSEMNFGFSEMETFSIEENTKIKEQFELMLHKYMKLKSGEIEQMFKNHEVDFEKKKGDSPLFQKK